MKISYGEKIKEYGKDGTVYTQRILLTPKELSAINSAIASEIAMNYPQARKYANSEIDAQMYLKGIRVEGNKAYLKLTQTRYISKFAETKGRIKTDRNTYIQVIEERTEQKLGKEKIRDWYIKNYPEDELGQDIKKNITFYNAFECLDRGKDFYNFLGVDDSVIRERVFQKLAKVMKCDYDYIYNQWLRK